MSRIRKAADLSTLVLFVLRMFLGATLGVGFQKVTGLGYGGLLLAAFTLIALVNLERRWFLPEKEKEQ